MHGLTPLLQLGHHGPAIENPYYALRLYFDRKGGIDISLRKPNTYCATHFVCLK